MTNRQRIAIEDLRLQALRVLAEDPELTLNIHSLRAALSLLGRDVRVDRLVALTDWLAEAGLVRFVGEEPPRIVRLNPRGLEFVEGRIVVRGVALPAL